MNFHHLTDRFQPVNRAFLHGDSVKSYFFARKGQLVMGEECYFFLMASMRKMRMNIPLTYTLEFFQNLLQREILEKGFTDGIITFMAFRSDDGGELQKTETDYYLEARSLADLLQIQGKVELDVIKEISVNTSLLSNIHVHAPENTYAEIYARENGLDDVILLNPQKRIARCGSGNLMLLTGDTIKIPRQSEGAYISPLLENLVTYIHKNNLAEISESELIPFETQKANEILLVSDTKGIFSVGKIRNMTFGSERFTGIIESWRESFH